MAASAESEIATSDSKKEEAPKSTENYELSDESYIPYRGNLKIGVGKEWISSLGYGYKCYYNYVKSQITDVAGDASLDPSRLSEVPGILNEKLLYTAERIFPLSLDSGTYTQEPVELVEVEVNGIKTLRETLRLKSTEEYYKDWEYLFVTYYAIVDNNFDKITNVPSAVSMMILISDEEEPQYVLTQEQIDREIAFFEKCVSRMEVQPK